MRSNKLGGIAGCKKKVFGFDEILSIQKNTLLTCLKKQFCRPSICAEFIVLFLLKLLSNCYLELEGKLNFQHNFLCYVRGFTKCQIPNFQTRIFQFGKKINLIEIIVPLQPNVGIRKYLKLVKIQSETSQNYSVTVLSNPFVSINKSFKFTISW